MSDRSEVKIWKKVYESDLSYVINEFKDIVEAPAIIVLEGEVGAGKTYFTQAFNPSLKIVSPTYSLISEDGDLAHADFYRIKSVEELDHLELPLYADEKEFFFIEWGRKFQRQICRLLGDDFKFYDLEISINDTSNQDHEGRPSRNYILSEIAY